MRKRMTVILLVLLIAAYSSIALAQQQAKNKPVAKAKASSLSIGVEPLRVINGEMQGRKIVGKVAMPAQPSNFSFTITKAEIVNGHLQLSGDFAVGGKQAPGGNQVTATIAGTMAKTDNPWPSAASAPPKEKSKDDKGEQRQGREAKNPESAGQLGELAQSTQSTARKTPSPEGERTEQTQSLYAQAEQGSGCGVIFLSLTLPPALRARLGAGAQPLQLGVVLAVVDNPTGEEINKQICRIMRAGKDEASGSGASAAIDQLNKLLNSAQ